MIESKHLDDMAEEIQKIRNSAERLQEMGQGIQSVECYASRILSNIRLLEMNVTDVAKVN